MSEVLLHCCLSGVGVLLLPTEAEGISTLNPHLHPPTPQVEQLIEMVKTWPLPFRVQSLHVYCCHPGTSLTAGVLRTLHPTPYTLHPTPYTPNPTPCTLHPTHYNL